MTTSDTLTLTQRKAKAREITGREPTNTIGLQLKALRDQGILIDLNISGTGMFQKTLTWLETGINDGAGDKRAENYTKGMKLLYPEPLVRKIKSIESRMRQLIGNYTFSITGFFPYRWLPYTAYDLWREKWDALVKEFDEVKEDMVRNHDKYVEQMRQEYKQVAQAAWDSMTSGGRYKNLKIRRKSIGVTMTESEFVSSFVDKTIAQIPDRSTIGTNLNAGYVTALVYGQADIAEDQAQATLIRERTRQEIERTAIENRRLNERLRQEAWNGQMDQREREIKIQAMRDAEMEHARKQLEEITSPFAEVFSAIRSRFAADAISLKESIERNGYVRGKVAEKGRGLIELFNLLAIHDDDELRNALTSLKNLLSTQGIENRDPEEIKRVLEDVADMADRETASLMIGPTAFSLVDVN